MVLIEEPIIKDCVKVREVDVIVVVTKVVIHREKVGLAGGQRVRSAEMPGPVRCIAVVPRVSRPSAPWPIFRPEFDPILRR